MVGITLSPEQIRAAPPDVRRWLEHEISTALGFGLNAAAPAAPRQHLISCSLEEARVLLSSIAGMLPVVAVFFELGREPAMPAAPGLRAFRLADMQRHARLESPDQIIAALEVINDGIRRLRGEPEATLYALDGQGHCIIADGTAVSVLRLWQEIVAARGLASAAGPDVGEGTDAPAMPGVAPPPG